MLDPTCSFNCNTPRVYETDAGYAILRRIRPAGYANLEGAYVLQTSIVLLPTDGRNAVRSYTAASAIASAEASSVKREEELSFSTLLWYL
jgi:hypothetical protein